MEKESVIAELHKLPGVSEKAAEGLYLLGIRSPKDLAEGTRWGCCPIEGSQGLLCRTLHAERLQDCGQVLSDQ